MKNGLDYELIDFGAGRKLERFGEIILNRPEILATDKPKWNAQEWEKRAHGKYFEQKKAVGFWTKTARLPKTWTCAYFSRKTNWNLELSPGKYKHVGVFPEQEKHWKYLEEHVKPGEDRKSTRLNSSHVRISYAVFCLKKKKKHQHPPSSHRRTSSHPPTISSRS